MPEDDPLPDRPPRRQDLETPYHHPYRVGAAEAWRSLPALRNHAVVAAALVVLGTIGALTVDSLLWLTAAVGAILAAWVVLVWSLAGAKNALALTRHWRRGSELRAVREARPHAGDADPHLAHDEYAVTVQDDGWLYTWRFHPLRVHERPDDDEVEVPGRPRYAATVITESRFDAHDAARAAEQLVAAQAHAETLEQRVIATAHGGIADATERAELAIEARTTAAALRRATGQDDRR